MNLELSFKGNAESNMPKKNALCDSVIVSGLLTYIRTYTHTEVILVYNRVNFVNSLLFLESWRGMSSERLPIFSFHRRKHNTNHCFPIPIHYYLDAVFIPS